MPRIDNDFKIQGAAHLQVELFSGLPDFIVLWKPFQGGVGELDAHHGSNGKEYHDGADPENDKRVPG